MAAKIKKLEDKERGRCLHLFYCPGCGRSHPYDERWQFNGDYEHPSFTPSLMVSRDHPTQCHLYVTDGKIRFLGDCKHALAGQTVDMVDWDDEEHW